MIGDPSGKTAMRRMMTREEIDHNVRCFQKQMSRLVDFSDGKAIMVNNADWLMNLNYIQFLREVGAVSYTHLAAKIFVGKLKAELSFLDMPGLRFLVRQSTCDLNRYGCDEIQFLISANPGEPPKPLSTIASGGCLLYTSLLKA